jgi:hypothetical protein
VLGTNPWFKKPLAIGEKVDSLRMVVKVRSGKRSQENTTVCRGRSSHLHILCLRKCYEYDSCLSCQDSHD